MADVVHPLGMTEAEVKREFGKPFDAAAARRRVPELRAFWSRFDLDSKRCLDLGSGHPVVPAVLTTLSGSVRIDAVDFSPDFERESNECVLALGGDPARVRPVTADFYHIVELAERGRLAARYDYVLFVESLHHSLQKPRLLDLASRFMDKASRMILLEPVLPIIGRERAYAQSQWARDLGYIEEPVTMREYLGTFSEAGLEVEGMGYEVSRENGPRSWKRRLMTETGYGLFRRRLRPLWALTSFYFICRLRPGARGSQ